MKGDYIKINRSLLDWDWYGDINTCRLFVHMLLRAKGRRKERKNIKILTYLSIAPAISGRSWRHGMILNDTESNLYAS